MGNNSNSTTSTIGPKVSIKIPFVGGGSFGYGIYTSETFEPRVRTY